uniref:Uncharacterized protein n=1 Tax=Pseudo-nitzschia australis TaxID=44445 RepID=A0A7S4AG37_9STRA|mmetsp:Transcript_11683/g.24696  ORF Transcript_11683/g.24696 Transcript_11683/m.24696 type:complete len:141 (+) Transcript_11683:377-799(+)
MYNDPVERAPNKTHAGIVTTAALSCGLAWPGLVWCVMVWYGGPRNLDRSRGMVEKALALPQPPRFQRHGKNHDGKLSVVCRSNSIKGAEQTNKQLHPFFNTAAATTPSFGSELENQPRDERTHAPRQADYDGVLLRCADV